MAAKAFKEPVPQFLRLTRPLVNQSERGQLWQFLAQRLY